MAERVEFLGRQIKSNWTEEEYEKLCAIARDKGIPNGRLVREIVIEFLRSELTTGDRLVVTAVREFQHLYLEVMRALLGKELTSQKLEFIEANVKACRRDLYVGFVEENA